MYSLLIFKGILGSVLFRKGEDWNQDALKIQNFFFMDWASDTDFVLF